jgi:release factor glutamine methyltransferase
VIVKDVLDAAVRLVRRNIGEATPWDAKLLLAHSVGHGRPLALDPREELPAEAASRFEALWEKRLSGAPVQHLVGEWDFFGRPFVVDARALVPRPETELLVEAALDEAPEAERVVDLGTGSGILAVTWLLERPRSHALAVDSSFEALALARSNARRHRVADRIELVAGDWLGSVAPASERPFDLAISNPPYLALSEAAALSATVRDHDPASALFAGEEGLDAIRRLLDEVPAFLAPGAPFLFEIGAGQAPAVEREIAARREWRFVRIVPDLGGIPRVAVLTRT